ncbi:MAG TPA: hypothetical protein VKI43_07550, partial [Vicinamibacterales bacterium]|nr:hypothetical protein [Vicinamibacterales bacterium]
MTRLQHVALVYLAVVVGAAGIAMAVTPTPAPTGIDNRTADTATATQAQHIADQATFEERDEIDKGLGPVFNMKACSDCHQHPVIGGISQVAELRAGSISGNVFTPASVTI